MALDRNYESHALSLLPFHKRHRDAVADIRSGKYSYIPSVHVSSPYTHENDRSETIDFYIAASTKEMTRCLLPPLLLHCNRYQCIFHRVEVIS